MRLGRCLMLLLLTPVCAAGAECVDEARALLPQVRSETNEIVRRAATAEANQAMDEAGDGDEAACRDHLARARGFLRDKPFRLDPGQTLGVPDDRRGVRPG